MAIQLAMHAELLRWAMRAGAIGSRRARTHSSQFLWCSSLRGSCTLKPSGASRRGSLAARGGNAVPFEPGSEAVA